MKKRIVILLGLLISITSYSQSQMVLEPVGRYIYQASVSGFTGTDHLLNTVALSDGKIMIVSNSALTIIDGDAMPIQGSTNYLMRSVHGGGRDAVIYKDTIVYVNFHQSESKPLTYGLGVSKITKSGITNLTTIKETNVFYEKMKVYGDYLFVAAHSNGIRIYSLSNPETPTLVGSLSKGFTDAFDLAVVGDTLYVADGGGGLKIVDISTLSSPIMIGGETTSSAVGTAQAIEVRDGRIYLASGGAGICVYSDGDLSTREVYPVIGCAEDLCWVGNYLAVSTFGGVSVYEVGVGTNLYKVASETTSRFHQRAYIRNSFGVGAINDSTLAVACWNSVDCYRIKSATASSVPDIICSAQRIRFPAQGGSETNYITNAGGASLNISNVSTLSSDFSSDLVPQSILPGDTVYFDITYTEGSEVTGEVLYINSNDPDENPLPIQVFGKTSSLDPGEEVPDFTLPTIYTDPATGIFSSGSFTLSEQLGKVVWIQVFGTWCPACPSAEVDMQNTIIREFMGNPNVATYVLNENQQERDPESWVTLWATKYYQRAPMIYDSAGTVGGITFSQPSVGNMPFGRGFIIDQNGKVAKAFFGHQPQMVISTIYDLLGSPASIVDKTNYDSNMITVYPNPATDMIHFDFQSIASQNSKISIINFLGIEIMSFDDKQLSGENSVDFSIEGLSSGMYYCVFSSQGTRISKSFAVIK